MTLKTEKVKLLTSPPQVVLQDIKKSFEGGSLGCKKLMKFTCLTTKSNNYHHTSLHACVQKGLSCCIYVVYYAGKSYCFVHPKTWYHLSSSQVSTSSQVSFQSHSHWKVEQFHEMIQLRFELAALPDRGCVRNLLLRVQQFTFLHTIFL